MCSFDRLWTIRCGEVDISSFVESPDTVLLIFPLAESELLLEQSQEHWLRGTNKDLVRSKDESARGLFSFGYPPAMFF